MSYRQNRKKVVRPPTLQTPKANSSRDEPEKQPVDDVERLLPPETRGPGTRTGAAKSPRWLFVTDSQRNGYVLLPLEESGAFLVVPRGKFWVVRTNLMRVGKTSFATAEAALSYAQLQVCRYSLDRYRRVPRILGPFAWSRLPQEVRKRVLAEILNLMADG
jgi:hypothetical protein